MTNSLLLEIDLSQPVLAFAADELRHFLADADTDGWRIAVEVDSALADYSFALAVGDGAARLTGHDATAALHAVYTLLERLGWRFEITGARRAEAVELAALAGLREVIQPAVNRRGIRQHLNFPMDISSYPLDEAKEYLRNLARLRFNHITFHSYGGQWYAVDYPGCTEPAGQYFYGQRHDLPDHPLLRRVIRNRETFCIPEHEALIDDREANSRAAVAWLQALMREAKRVGLEIQFSFELREGILDLSLVTVDAILAAYPLIDRLEIITEETGLWAAAPAADDLRALVAETFGQAALDDPAIAPHLTDGQKDMDKLARQIGHNIVVIDALRQSGRALPPLALGVYCTVPSDQKLILALLQRYVPDGVEYALLFDHGNRAVAANLRALDMPSPDWARTLVYSWIEFDGTMYLSQNALKGIDDLVRLAVEKMGAQPVNGIALNHWRTTENRTTARYASETLLRGVLERGAFYADYAKSLGIGRADDYARAMHLLDDADSAARYDLPNVGFCYVGTWRHEGLGYYGVFQHEKVLAVRGMYAEALGLLRGCLDATASPDGRDYLAFIVNRVSATVEYLHAIDAATELQPICAGRTPEQLAPGEREAVRAICDRALALMETYMHIHAEMLPDRGCEGTLISFYYTPPAVLKHIRAEYGYRITLSGAAASFDAPPSPIAEEESTAS